MDFQINLLKLVCILLPYIIWNSLKFVVSWETVALKIFAYRLLKKQHNIVQENQVLMGSTGQSCTSKRHTMSLSQRQGWWESQQRHALKPDTNWQRIFSCKSWVHHQTSTSNPKIHHVQETNKVTSTDLFKLLECLCYCLPNFSPHCTMHIDGIYFFWWWFHCVSLNLSHKIQQLRSVETQISPQVYKEQHSQRCLKNLHSTLQSPQSSLCIQLEKASLFIILIRMELLLQTTRNTTSNQRTPTVFFLHHFRFTKMYLISLEASCGGNIGWNFRRGRNIIQAVVTEGLNLCLCVNCSDSLLFNMHFTILSLKRVLTRNISFSLESRKA